MSRSRFCPKCGKPITEGRLCSDCTTTTLQYEMPKIQVSEFSRSYEKGRWVQFYDLESLIVKKVKEGLGQDVPVELEPFEFEPIPKTKVMLTAHATIEGKDVELPVRLSYRQCDFGQKQKTGYYEGILQIQNAHDDVLEYLRKELDKVESKGIFVTKTVETKTGIDLYFTNKNFLRIIGQRVINKFGGELILNPQLFTRNHLTSKDVYRLNALVKLPIFRKGDVISYAPDKVRVKKGQIHVVKVTSMGKLIKAIDLVTKLPLAFELKFVKDLKVLPVRTAQISAEYPELSIIDPDTFQEAIPLNEVLEEEYEVNDEVQFVKTPFGPLIVE